jgi:cytochrome c oxidase subunit IV
MTDTHAAHHPTPRQYVNIGLILAAMTAVEVGLYYFSLGAANTPVLLLLASAKFAVVAAYFMHLKFDKPILRNLFVTGIVFALGVYLAYLLMLGTFIG